MRLQINGEQHDLDVVTLKDVVNHFGLQEGLVVTEVDEVIIDRSDWKDTKVQDGMNIELVHFVGGG
ncbi:sulfur carrier protein ThiS [Bacillus sp. RAR_GA_16]|uniref:sulfur carrier protein ThiS n=1 Tax=Bacillus sp. RAR_GA_16 TaxID=2876774 RepID=UPI001CCE1118|nr:sulfur carrier protein ThiS [Bacillus sp. RAR_GA_16]MCA0171071.1 sulfur carrier protein ThiS [Bacillus sp. RAR_GA_16]